MVKVNIRRVQRVDFAVISNRYKNKLGKIVDLAQSELKKMLPKKSGKLANSVKVTKSMSGSKWGFSIRALSYYIFLNEGTKDHYVAPVKKRALAWVDDGGVRFSKGHTVSGIKAGNYTKKVKEYILRQIRSKSI